MPELPTIKIRAFFMHDIPEALRLWSGVKGMGLSESDSPEGIRRFLDRNPGFSAVARDQDDKIVGALLCGHNGRWGSLYHLAVAHASRGQGIAQALVDFSVERLREEGIIKCNLFVYNDNEEGNRFWLRNGWEDPTNWKVMHKRVIP
jgi:putative acetyltransferase